MEGELQQLIDPLYDHDIEEQLAERMDLSD